MINEIGQIILSKDVIQVQRDEFPVSSFIYRF